MIGRRRKCRRLRRRHGICHEQVAQSQPHGLLDRWPPDSTSSSRSGVLRLVNRRLFRDPLDRAACDSELCSDLFCGLPRLQQGVNGMSVDHPEHPPRLLPLDSLPCGTAED
jgi:hypothetical protein